MADPFLDGKPVKDGSGSDVVFFSYFLFFIS